MTLKEIADLLNLKPITARKRIETQGIVPIRLVGTTAIYSPDTVEKIRDIKMGRPRKEKAGNN